MTNFLLSELRNSKPIYLPGFSKLKLIFCFALFLSLGSQHKLAAQTTITVGAASGAANANALFSTSTTGNKYARTVSVYTASELLAAGATPGNITKIAWHKSGAGEYTANDISLAVYIKPVTYTIHPTDPVDWATEIVGATQVYNSTTATFPTGIGWADYTFTTPYLWNGSDNIEILVDFYRPGAPTASITWQYTTVADGTTATQVSSTPIPTVRHATRRPDVQLTFVPSGPCTVPPAAGQAASTLASVCPNVNFNLTLSGTSHGAGQTYQWQSSANGTSGWANITGATTPTFTTSQTSTTHYRAQVTCSGQSAFSAPVQVTTNATPVTGPYTINKNATPSATVFNSFTAAFASLDCGGIGGPLVINVAPNSGTYTEQLTIGQINGASATNTITINGNNNKITFAPTSADRFVIRLDGTDFLTIDSLQVEATGTTYGWGIHLMNSADNNTISNNNIIIGSTSTTESNSAGIVLSNSSTAVTSAGNNGNNNIISGNTITGGHGGIKLSGTSGLNGNNQVLNNIIRDVYSYGIEISAANNTLVEGNNISRPLRPTVGTLYGIYLSSTPTGTTVSKNRIHNTNGTDPTSTVYGLYISSSDATAGQENIFSNNLIYNVNSTGTVYGIYNSNSDGAYYYHNTVDLTNTANTGTNRGFWQTGAATDVRFINNIITINAGASGTKHAIYFTTATSAITSNNNVLYVTGGAAASGIGYQGSNQATLADWQALGYDANSVSADPQYAAPATGDFTPTNVAVNNKGQGVGITTDINGTSRNPGMPDPGAYEFLNNPNDVGITAITSPNSVCGLTNAEIITVVLTNFGTTVQNNIPVSYTLNGGTPVTEIITGPLNPGGTITFSFTVPVNLSAAGGYTIVASANMAGDSDVTNNSTTKVVTNAFFPALPISLDFETTATGVTSMKQVINTQSNISENAAASNGPGSTKGMVMSGGSSASWTLPVGTGVDPWAMNPEHFAATYICFSPAGGSASDSLWLTFDLKQLFKTANINTNFRITVNGQQIGTTFRPPFSGSGSWQKVKFDLTSYRNLPSIEIGFESSVAEAFANGTGPANLVDNIMVVRRIIGSAKDDFLQKNLTVFPNPSEGTFYVELPGTKAYSLEVTDLAGKTVKAQTAVTGKNTISLEGTAKGIYLLKVSSKDGIAVKKLIVK